jgi:hypothetical protein
VVPSLKRGAADLGRELEAARGQASSRDFGCTVVDNYYLVSTKSANKASRQWRRNFIELFVPSNPRYRRIAVAFTSDSTVFGRFRTLIGLMSLLPVRRPLSARQDASGAPAS